MRKIAPVFWIVLLLGIPAGLYYLYFSAQVQRITELNQRELGRASENLKEILGNGVQTLRNLSKTPSYTCAFNERQPYLQLADDLDCHAFETRAADGKSVGPESDIEATVTEHGIRLSAIDIRPQGQSLAFDVRLEKALDELVISDGFEYLFLARGDGAVVFQTRRGERKRWLDQLRWFDRHARDQSVPVTNPLRLHKLADLQSNGTSIQFRNLCRTSSSIPIQIGGAAYRLHVQPFVSLLQLRYRKPANAVATGPTPTDSDLQMSDLILGGLVKESASSQAALAIDPQYSVLLALLVGLGILSWPILKFFVLAPHERFRFVDFALLLLSTSATLGFLVILCLDTEAYYHLKLRDDHRLQILANQIQSDFIDEVGKMRSQLLIFDQAAPSHQNAEFNCEGILQLNQLFASERAKILDLPTDLSHWQYPSFISVFWARGRDGLQIAKLTALAANTAQVSVASRNYFTEARTEHLWEFTSDDKSAPRARKGFFIQPYRSITTGDFETALSMRSQTACPPTVGEKNVAVITALLQSFRPRPLPPDLGFMVLDRSGRVLFHSDERRALREDLFEEIADSGSLRAIVLSGRPESLASSYRGVPHSFWIQPIDGISMHMHSRLAVDRPVESIGWSLVTFQDLELSRTIISEAIITALVWGAFYFLLIQFVPAAVFVWIGPKQLRWLWPTRGKGTLYSRLTVELLGVILVSALLLSRANDWSLLLTSYAVGGVALSITVLECIRSLNAVQPSEGQGEKRGANDISEQKPLTGTKGSRVSHIHRLAPAIFLLITVSVLPAIGLVKFSWDHEIGAALNYERDHILQTQDDLVDQLRERKFRQFGIYGPHWRDLTVSVYEQEQRAIANPLFKPFQFPSTYESADVLAAPKPVYNDASAELRYRRAGRIGRSSPLRTQLGTPSVCGGLVLIVLLVVWIDYVSKRLLLADLPDSQEPLDRVLKRVKEAMDSKKNIVLVVSSATQEAEVGQELIAPLAKAAPAGTVSTKGGRMSLTEVLSDHDTRRTALQNLEALSANGGALVFSRVDPVQYCVARCFSAPDQTLDEIEHRRWAAVLERFAVVPIPVQSEPEPLGENREVFYWSVWNSCSDSEKLALIHVAEEGLANPRDRRTVERLLRRGLLVLNPELKVFSEGFRNFLHQVRDPENVKQWETPVRFGWTHLRWILIALFIAILLFLLSTQQQSLVPVITFTATLTGAVSGVLKLISDFSPKQRLD